MAHSNTSITLPIYAITAILFFESLEFFAERVVWSV